MPSTSVPFTLFHVRPFVLQALTSLPKFRQTLHISRKSFRVNLFFTQRAQHRLVKLQQVVTWKCPKNRYVNKISLISVLTYQLAVGQSAMALILDAHRATLRPNNLLGRQALPKPADNRRPGR